MKIVFMRLKNFIGISEGMGRKEFTLDLSADNIPEIILLVGGNGKGKTTILSHLQPFASNNDGREFTVFENENGEKEIHIIDGEVKYIITHFYNKKKEGGTHTVKSFIKQIKPDGTEVDLNESGGVRSFAEVLKSYLGIDSDYFRVGRIGSNVTNFIQLNSSDRKRLISRFLPDIDGYLAINKDVTSYLGILRGQIKFVSNELEKIGDISILNDKARLAIQTITTKEEHYSSILQEISVLQHRLKEAVSILGINYEVGSPLPDLTNPYTSVVTDLIMKQNAIEKAIEEKIQNPENRSYEKIRELIEEYRIKCEKSGEANVSARMGYSEISSKISSLVSEIKSKSDFIKNKSDVDKRIKTVTQQIESVSESFAQSQEYLDVVADRRIVELVQRVNLNELYSKADIFNNSRDKFSKFKPDTFVMLYGSTTPNEIVETMRTAIKAMEGNRVKYQADINKYTSEMMFAKHLNQIKTANNGCGCSDPNCPYEGILTVAPVDNTAINELKVKIAEIDLEIQNCNEVINVARNEYAPLLDLSVFMAKELEYMINTFDLTVYNPELSDFMSLSDSDKYKYVARVRPEISYKDVYSTAAAYNFIEANRGRVEELRATVDDLQSSKAVVESITIQIQELEQTKLALENEKVAHSEALAKAERILNNNKNALMLLEDVSNKFIQLKEISSQITQQSELLEQYDQNVGNANECLEALQRMLPEADSVKEMITVLKREHEAATINIARYKEFTEKKASIEEDYAICNDVKYASDVVTGVPLYLTQGYLEEIRNIANPLLDAAYHGGFRLEPFVVTDKDFMIPIRKRSQFVCNDICEASQGEVAFTKTALSLAIFKRAMSRYNIPSLDEVDSELDGANRSMFIRVLQDQVRELNLEQVFVISHNNAFYEAPIGLICCADHGLDLHDQNFMSNKVLVKDCTE